jgi:hypothetical protein
MRLKLVACKVMQREISAITALSPHFIDTTYLRQGLHNTPKILNDTLAAEIAHIDAQEDLYSCPPMIGLDFDAVLLGYGLCSNGVVGLSSSRYRLVVPRVHDCISLLLGSRDRYDKLFAENSGTYWYTPGWMENSIVPSKNAYDKLMQEYTEKFGEEEALYIMEASGNWKEKYNRATYIEWDELPLPDFRQRCGECAREMGWECTVEKGTPNYLEDLLSGRWDEKRFLVAPPGHQIQPSYNNDIIGCQSCQD